MKSRLAVGALALVCLAGNCRAQNAAPQAIWNALLAPGMDGAKFARMDNVEIVRDRVKITLKSGTIQFLNPLNGRAFGAVFHGEGRVQVAPPNPIEAQQLRLFTGADSVAMTFTEATFTFTDGFLEEIGKQAKFTSGTGSDELYVRREREREQVGELVQPRLFQGVMAKAADPRTAYFMADLHTKEKGWVEVRDDALEPEDIQVGRWAEVAGGRRFDTWMSFPAGGKTSSEAWDHPQSKEDYVVTGYKIEAAVTSNAELHATAQVAVQSLVSGQNVMIFGLDSNLRVESVKDASGSALTFVQARESKDRFESYGDYVAVILPSALVQGTAQTLNFTYGGKRAIRKAGNGNYFCESTGWYPDRPNSFAGRADFDITFRSPKNLVLVATGEKTSETVDGNTRITTWKNDIPLAVAGFAYGDYKVYNDKANDVAVNIYANREPDDVMASVQRYFDSGQALAAVGTMSPAAMAKTMGVEMSNMIRVFENYFGPFPYKHLSVTSMPISYSYGQGWPGLIYLWSGSFLDSTQRHAIGIVDQTAVSDFFRAHETSHQWWGHRVGWKSYHDQWLSEGFAEFSGNLYVQYRQNMKEYVGRWRLEKEQLKRRDAHGHLVGELGPIWMGQRIASSESDGRAYQDLIYSKGGYVLHMLREQLSDSHNPDNDHLFKAMMQDYCKTFDNKAASTEDFKMIVERHMTKGMDLDGNHKMDWFFNQYVYGTALPTYNFHATTEAMPDGKTHIKGTIVRTGVPDSWKDAIPLYAHMGDKVVRLGSIGATHATEPFDTIVPGKVDKVSINEFEELLGDVHQ